MLQRISPGAQNPLTYYQLKVHERHLIYQYPLGLSKTGNQNSNRSVEVPVDLYCDHLKTVIIIPLFNILRFLIFFLCIFMKKGYDIKYAEKSLFPCFCPCNYHYAL